MADRRFRVDLAPAAGRQLAKLSPDAQRRIVRALHALEVDPRPRGVQQLSGVQGAPQWRLRVGDYRAIYEVTTTVCWSWSFESAIEGRSTDFGERQVSRG